MPYSARLLDLCNNPRNVGSLPADDLDVGTGVASGSQCGDTVRLQLRVSRASGIIDEAKFKTFGCGPAIATASLATAWLKEKTLAEALLIREADFTSELELPRTKQHCALLAVQAIAAAVADYRKKQEGGGEPAERRAATSNSL